jgi:hypothetical protein
MADDEQRPPPLTPPDCNLQDFEFVPVLIRRFLSSETWVMGTDSERAAATALWFESWHQVPAASLPDNDRMLAHLSQSKTWPRVRAHVMRGWVLCSDGRYYHRIVAWKALEAWLEKLLQQASGGSTNAKRWGAEFDGPAMLARLQDAISRLESIEPSSKALKKKAVVLAKQGHLPGAGPEPKPPAPTPTAPPPGPSAPGSPPVSRVDSDASRNRKGEGEGQREGQGQGLGNPPSGDNPPTPRKRGARAPKPADPTLVALEQLLEQGVQRQHAEDWLRVRKDKGLSLTRTAWEEVVKQAGLAGITTGAAVQIAAANSWGGFRANWLTRENIARPDRVGNRQQQLEAGNLDVGQTWAARSAK